MMGDCERSAREGMFDWFSAKQSERQFIDSASSYAGGYELSLRLRQCQIAHKFRCRFDRVACGRDGALVSGIVLDLFRQRANECHIFAGVLDDHRRRTEGDFPAGSVADMVEDGSEIGIACGFGCQLRSDTEPVEKRLE